MSVAASSLAAALIDGAGQLTQDPRVLRSVIDSLPAAAEAAAAALEKELRSLANRAKLARLAAARPESKIGLCASALREVVLCWDASTVSRASE